MNAASLDLCRALHELSGWDSPYVWQDGHAIHAKLAKAGPFQGFAYDLGYLLRKLPRSTYDDYRLTLQPVVYPQWCASYDEMDSGNTNLENYADTPEDAAAKLAIGLFKHGILAKEAGEARA